MKKITPKKENNTYFLKYNQWKTRKLNKKTSKRGSNSNQTTAIYVNFKLYFNYPNFKYTL